MEKNQKETLAQRFSPNSYLTTFEVPKEYIPSKETLELYIEVAKKAESTIKIFGGIKPKRDFFAVDSYNFSGSTHKGIKIEDGGWREKFIDFLNKEIRKEGDPEFNATLVNVYTPDSGIGKHSDSEKDLVENSPVVGVSFYVGEEGPANDFERTIKFTKKKDSSGICKSKKEKVKVPRKKNIHFLPIKKEEYADSFNLKLGKNRGYVMRGKFQKEVEHRIDPEHKKNGKRISFTFRCFKNK
jgi:hypothetical protein